MRTDVQHLRFQEASGMERVYSPDILPRLQALLADLADIDLAFEMKLEAIECGTDDEGVKRKIIAQLRRDHQERCAPYVMALQELQEQARGCFNS